MKQLPLTTGGFTWVDDDVYQWANRHTWWATRRGHRLYVVRHAVSDSGKWTKRYLHREILRLARGEYGDHRKGNGLDNRRQNLRVCTNQQNAAAFRVLKADKTSRYRGVHFDRARSLWVASIKKMYQKIFLGRFAQEKDAARAYNAAAQRLFGSFAEPNKI